MSIKYYETYEPYSERVHDSYKAVFLYFSSPLSKFWQDGIFMYTSCLYEFKGKKLKPIKGIQGTVYWANMEVHKTENSFKIKALHLAVFNF